MGNDSDLLGKKALDAFKYIIHSAKSVTSIYITQFKSPPKLQERVKLSFPEEEIIKNAMRLREETNLPFWDSVLIKSLGSKKPPKGIFNGLQYHQPVFNEVEELSIFSLENGSLNEKIRTIHHPQVLAVSSKVKLLDGTMGHIPMLDFHCPISNENRETVEAVVKLIFNSKAVLLESGRSYHAMGAAIVSTERLIDFFSKAILFSPIVDKMYVAHQLLERQACLRISRGGRENMEPTVIGVL